MTAVSARRSSLDPRRLLDAEDRARDHLEGQRAHALAHREAVAGAPARDLALGDVADHRAEGGDGGALERRQQQAPMAQVLGAVEHEHRAVADDDAQRCVRLARTQVRLVAGVERSDRLRVGDVDAGAKDRVAHREAVAVARVPLQQRLERPLCELGEVERGGAARTRRERGGRAAGHGAANVPRSGAHGADRRAAAPGRTIVTSRRGRGGTGPGSRSSHDGGRQSRKERAWAAPGTCCQPSSRRSS